MTAIFSTGSNARAVTPSDTVDLPDGPAKALYIGVAGDIKVTPAGAHKDDPRATAGIEFTNVPVGWFLMSVRRVWSTDTAASGIIAIYE